MSEAGVDMLSDIHLATFTDSPTHTAMQIDTNDLTDDLTVAKDTTLALPRALLGRTNWTTRRTRTLIEAIVGTDDNRQCTECRRILSTTRRLRIHVPQHFTVTFCPCGVHHFCRDTILRHQRTRDCYVGHLYEVDADSYTEFRDLILPHVTDPDRRQTLLDHFPATRPTVESDSDADPQPSETTTTYPPDVTTQPLRVVVTRAGRAVTKDSQPPTTTISYVPRHTHKKKRGASNTPRDDSDPDQSLLADIRKVQRRMARLSKEQKRATTELAKLQTRLEKRLAKK